MRNKTPMETIKYMPELQDSHLEPRVARLETGLETLIRNVNDMAIAMRENVTATNQKIDALVVAVTQAQAPKKTDWSLLLSIGFFILALGSAVFWPLNKTSQDNKTELTALEQKFDAHLTLPGHPLSQAKVEGLQKDIDQRWSTYILQYKELDDKIQRETTLMNELVTTKLQALDERIQKEFNLKNETFTATMSAAVNKQDLINQRYFERILRLEEYNALQVSKEQDELRQWRQKAMGLSTPDAVVPLVPRTDLIRKK